VRELKNVVERSLVLGKLPSDCCPPTAGEHRHDGVTGFPLDWPLAVVEQHHMLRVLDSVGGNKSEAARRLGVSRKTLDRKLALWGDSDVADAGAEPGSE
jgi:DNA-binding NtrC family response regulator